MSITEDLFMGLDLTAIQLRLACGTTEVVGWSGDLSYENRIEICRRFSEMISTINEARRCIVFGLPPSRENDIVSLVEH